MSIKFLDYVMENFGLGPLDEGEPDCDVVEEV